MPADRETASARPAVIPAKAGTHATERRWARGLPPASHSLRSARDRGTNVSLAGLKAKTRAGRPAWNEP